MGVFASLMCVPHACRACGGQKREQKRKAGVKCSGDEAAAACESSRGSWELNPGRTAGVGNHWAIPVLPTSFYFFLSFFIFFFKNLWSGLTKLTSLNLNI